MEYVRFCNLAPFTMVNTKSTVQSGKYSFPCFYQITPRTNISSAFVNERGQCIRSYSWSEQLFGMKELTGRNLVIGAGRFKRPT